MANEHEKRYFVGEMPPMLPKPSSISQGYLMVGSPDETKPTVALVVQERCLRIYTLKGALLVDIPVTPADEKGIELLKERIWLRVRTEVRPDGVIERTLTIKGLKVGDSCPEFEYAISPETAESLMPHAVYGSLFKKRHRIPSGALTLELDVFEGDLAPLQLVEVEFPTPGYRFQPPSWFGREITHWAYSNANLARYGIPAG